MGHWPKGPVVPLALRASGYNTKFTIFSENSGITTFTSDSGIITIDSDLITNNGENSGVISVITKNNTIISVISGLSLIIVKNKSLFLVKLVKNTNSLKSRNFS